MMPNRLEALKEKIVSVEKELATRFYVRGEISFEDMKLIYMKNNNVRAFWIHKKENKQLLTDVSMEDILKAVELIPSLIAIIAEEQEKSNRKVEEATDAVSLILNQLQGTDK